MKDETLNIKQRKYTIRAEATFEAAHNLRLYHGKPEPLHGHSWKVEVFVSREGLDDEGMVADFLEVKKALDLIIKPLDHAHINEIPPFDKLNPSAENMASWIFEILSKKFSGKPYHISKIIVWEGPQYCAFAE